MKTYGGGGCIIPRFLDLSTSWRWVVSFTPQPLYSRGKSPRYKLDAMLIGPQTGVDDMESDHSWSYKDLNSDLSVVQPVASHYTEYSTAA
jgi:hypothetical protein